MFCCSNCFADAEIKAIINGNKKTGDCDFCGKHNVPVYETILDKGIMPSEKVLDFPVDCNTLTGSVNL